jgi:hypothetical protein
VKQNNNYTSIIIKMYNIEGRTKGGKGVGSHRLGCRVGCEKML